MPTVVVLPLVPVTASHGAGIGCACAIHHASSGSPTTGTRALATSGWSGRRPGPVTTSATSDGSSSGPGDGALGQVGERLRTGVA